jgi:hypothetical protein
MRANDNLILPSFNKLIIDYETDIYTFHENYYDHLAVNDSFAVVNNTLLDQIIKSFEYLDTAIDEENTEKVGKDLVYKYDTLEKKTDYEIIFSQIYRILIVLRNARVHESKSITANKDNISVVRKDRKDKNIKFIAKKDIIKYILSYAIYYNNVRNIKINEVYKLNIALWYYLRIKSLILEFIDSDNSIVLMDTKNIPILAGICSRYICENVRYGISNNMINLCIKSDYLYFINHQNNLLDFVFEIENKNFMVPYEIIENGAINISKLQTFELIGDKLEYLKKFYNGLMIKK